MSETPSSAAARPEPAPGIVVYAVPEGKRISLGAPSLIALPNGKLLTAFDQSGPDVKSLAGKKGHDAKRNRWMQGRVMSSSDGGTTWHLVATFPFRRASLFRDGGDVYLVGEASGGLCLMRSPDGGSSWSAPLELTGDLDLWLSPTSVISADDHWLLPCLAPVGQGMGLTLWRAPKGASLMNRKAWVQGSVSPTLSQLIPAVPGAGFGVPLAGAPMAWRDPLLVKVADLQHPWHVARTLLVFTAVDSGRQHWAAMLRLSTEDWSLGPQATRDGNPWTWLPLPGGHEKFDLFYDESSGRYWLVACRGSPHSFSRRGQAAEVGLQNMGLWSSVNLLDWDFTGEVASGGGGLAGIRCDPAAAVCGRDLMIACRAGGPHTRNVRETSQLVVTRRLDFRAGSL